MGRRRKWEEFTKHCPTSLESNLQKGQECGKSATEKTFFFFFLSRAVCQTQNISIACVTKDQKLDQDHFTFLYPHLFLSENENGLGMEMQLVLVVFFDERFSKYQDRET